MNGEEGEYEDLNEPELDPSTIIQVDEQISVEDLTSLLGECKIDVTKWAKTPADLKKELMCGDCYLNITRPDGTTREMTRLVQPVFIKLRVAGSVKGSHAGKDMILYNTKDIMLSRGNKLRERNV